MEVLKLNPNTSIPTVMSLDTKNEAFAVMTMEGELWEVINGNPPRSSLILSSHHSQDLLGLCT
jgi:hypothetical protein